MKPFLRVLMDEPTIRRDYLRKALADHDVEMKQASLAIGRNPTYIQQYIGTARRPPAPTYLHEQDRKALVRVYPFLEEDKLKPPEKALPTPSNFHRWQAEFERYPIEDGERQQLLRTYSRLDPEQRAAWLTLLSRDLPDDTKAVG
jgi:hypothetical protein